MRRMGVAAVVTADTGFDGLGDIERLEPADLDVWSLVYGFREV